MNLEIRESERKSPLFVLFKKKYHAFKKSDKHVTFSGLGKFLKDYFFEDFKPAFLPTDSYTKSMSSFENLKRFIVNK